MKKTKAKVQRLKRSKINAVKQQFELVSFSDDLSKFRMNNKKGEFVDVICLDPERKNIDSTKLIRGVVITALATRRVVKDYGAIVITHLLGISKPVQPDLEDFLSS